MPFLKKTILSPKVKQGSTIKRKLLEKQLGSYIRDDIAKSLQILRLGSGSVNELNRLRSVCSPTVKYSNLGAGFFEVCGVEEMSRVIKNELDDMKLKVKTKCQKDTELTITVETEKLHEERRPVMFSDPCSSNFRCLLTCKLIFHVAPTTDVFGRRISIRSVDSLKKRRFVMSVYDDFRFDYLGKLVEYSTYYERDQIHENEFICRNRTEALVKAAHRLNWKDFKNILSQCDANDILRPLVGKFMDVKCGTTALHEALLNRAPSDCVSVFFEFASKEGRNLELVCMKDDDKRTPLHAAVRSLASDETIRVLLAYGANVNEQDYQDYIPLHYAMEVGQESVINMLLEKGSNMVARGKYFNDTPLQIGISSGNMDRKTLKRLLKKYVFENIAGGMHIQDGTTDTKDKARVQIFKTDTIDIYGNTLLHLAVLSGRFDYCLELLNVGFDAFSPDFNGISSLKAVQESEDEELGSLFARTHVKVGLSSAKFIGLDTKDTEVEIVVSAYIGKSGYSWEDAKEMSTWTQKMQEKIMLQNIESFAFSKFLFRGENNQDEEKSLYIQVSVVNSSVIRKSIVGVSLEEKPLFTRYGEGKSSLKYTFFFILMTMNNFYIFFSARSSNSIFRARVPNNISAT